MKNTILSLALVILATFLGSCDSNDVKIVLKNGRVVNCQWTDLQDHGIIEYQVNVGGGHFWNRDEYARRFTHVDSIKEILR